LQLQRRRFNKPIKCNHPNNNTNDIHNVISISANIADSTSLDTAIFFCGQSAREGIGDKGTAERGGEFIVGWRWNAGCDCEGVDEFEDEEAGEGAA